MLASVCHELLFGGGGLPQITHSAQRLLCRSVKPKWREMLSWRPTLFLCSFMNRCSSVSAVCTAWLHSLFCGWYPVLFHVSWGFERAELILNSGNTAVHWLVRENHLLCNTDFLHSTRILKKWQPTNQRWKDLKRRGLPPLFLCVCVMLMVQFHTALLWQSAKESRLRWGEHQKFTELSRDVPCSGNKALATSARATKKSRRSVKHK